MYIVCYSGGVSSALVAIEAVRKHGKDNVILLNHDISPEVEHADIKRFKQEVADYLGLKITYANHEEWNKKTPIDICLDLGALQYQAGNALCTKHLKTDPFMDWLNENYPASSEDPCEDIVLLYGFDANEKHRIQRRSSILATKGYKTDYPLAFWNRTIQDIEDIGIKPPITYRTFKHANCIGCLKAGKQHWYIVFCLRPDIFKKAKEAEEKIGYSIIKGCFLDEIECKYKHMKERGIVPSEKLHYNTFWAKVRKELGDDNELPCDCSY